MHGGDGADDICVVEGIILESGRKAEHHFPWHSTCNAVYGKDTLATVVHSNEVAVVHSNLGDYEGIQVIYSSSHERRVAGRG
eukprot:2731031-Ditylum_brightwellii.AAC.1